MRELPELFSGFRSETIEGDGTDIFCRIGGEGPPLVCLHGFPETHAMWHRIAPALAARYTVVLPDLRGYGQSGMVGAGADVTAYSKRAMAKDVVAVMNRLGYSSFRVAGHDRGGRVAYRLALDFPEVVEKLALLDIIPTAAMWDGITVQRALAAYHWLFLAQNEPMPELLIARAPIQYLDYTMAAWTKSGNLTSFDERALAHYRAFYKQTERMHATCEDYRAGATADWDDDRADQEAGRKIAAPTLVLWGSHGIPGHGIGPLRIWEDWAENVEGHEIESGHFLCEEAPDETLAALLLFFEEPEADEDAPQ
ncbi:alpha/beta fold hydrolase [Amorphus orientalis]|uniref:Haloacetate dehalogenase n=1 Tax=Amorphus orientalis TaxID=649198 RepID=A0AAE3VRB6_9HYPH|nr:alpha/beta hydrolase [Amorphus orientalis]MDQ0316733.1 haloacetate dehalogenase [Amorphus orientalis]